MDLAGLLCRLLVVHFNFFVKTALPMLYGARHAAENLACSPSLITLGGQQRLSFAITVLLALLLV
jgi:hypothetical protein